MKRVDLHEGIDSTLLLLQHRLKGYTICTEILNLKRVGVWIKNNGPDIPLDVQSRIFNPFFTTKASGKGTGLGLSLSHQIIVEKHHGKIDCISHPNLGTEFCIEIPVQQERSLK